MFAGVKSLTDRYASMFDITKKEAEKRIKEIEEVFRAELLDPESEGIQLIDFITLKKMERASKIGRNPRNPSQTYQIPKKIGIKCDLGNGFDKELNSN